jgi:hypothetical protein
VLQYKFDERRDVGASVPTFDMCVMTSIAGNDQAAEHLICPTLDVVEPFAFELKYYSNRDFRCVLIQCIRCLIL